GRIIAARHGGDDAGGCRYTGAQSFEARDQTISVPIIARDIVIVGWSDDPHPQRVGVSTDAADQGMPSMPVSVDQSGDDQFAGAVHYFFTGMPDMEFFCRADIDD